MADPRVLVGDNGMQKTYVADGESVKNSVAIFTTNEFTPDPRMSTAIEVMNNMLHGYLSDITIKTPMRTAEHICDIVDAVFEECKKRKWYYPVDNSVIDKLYENIDQDNKFPSPGR